MVLSSGSSGLECLRASRKLAEETGEYLVDGDSRRGSGRNPAGGSHFRLGPLDLGQP